MLHLLVEKRPPFPCSVTPKPRLQTVTDSGTIIYFFKVIKPHRSYYYFRFITMSIPPQRLKTSYPKPTNPLITSVSSIRNLLSTNMKLRMHFAVLNFIKTPRNFYSNVVTILLFDYSQTSFLKRTH